MHRFEGNKLMVVGAGGQLGRELARRYRDFEMEALFLDRRQLDITHLSHVQKAVADCRPDLVINATAYNDVEGAETHPEDAFAVNGHGPDNLAKACASVDAALVHVSTDFVFDGSKRQPYVEQDPVTPLGIYGQSKAQGEQRVRSRLQRHLIIRTAWLYSEHGKNFVKTILRLAMEKPQLNVVADQWGCPTSAADLADAILSMARRLAGHSPPPWGTYHYCGEGEVTWHGFAAAIIATAADAKLPLTVLHPTAVSTAQYPSKVRRPSYSVLNCDKIGSNFGIPTRPWQASLTPVVHNIIAKQRGEVHGQTRNH